MSNGKGSKMHLGVGLALGILLLFTLSVRNPSAIPFSSQDPILWDEIHTINPPDEYILIDALAFREAWYYEFSFEVVSPHFCTAIISILDIEGFEFLIYSGILISEESIICKFGAVFSGDHSLKLEIQAETVINLRIRVRVLGSISEVCSLGGKIITTSSIRLTNSLLMPNISFSLNKNDTCSVLIIPMSPIHDENSIMMNISLEDPHLNHFLLFQGNIEEEIRLTFQTNSEGLHLLGFDVINLDCNFNFIVFVITDLDVKIKYLVPLEAHLLSGTIVFTLIVLPYLLIRKSLKDMN